MSGYPDSMSPKCYLRQTFNNPLAASRACILRCSAANRDGMPPLCVLPVWAGADRSAEGDTRCMTANAATGYHFEVSISFARSACARTHGGSLNLAVFDGIYRTCSPTAWGLMFLVDSGEEQPVVGTVKSVHLRGPSFAAAAKRTHVATFCDGRAGGGERRRADEQSRYSFCRRRQGGWLNVFDEFPPDGRVPNSSSSPYVQVLINVFWLPPVFESASRTRRPAARLTSTKQLLAARKLVPTTHETKSRETTTYESTRGTL